MALSRKLLSAMGIEDEKIEEIISAHTETVNALKQERDGFKKDAGKYQQASEDLKKANDKIVKLEQAAKNGEPDPYKAKYETVKADFDKYKADIEAKAARQAKETAYKEILKDAKVAEKHFAKILKYSDIDALELSEDGELKNKAELLKSVREEWSDHIESQSQQGANVANPPANEGNGAKQESYAARRAREYHENMYGKLKEV